MEERFAELAAAIALGIEAIAVLIVGIGALDAGFRIVAGLTQRNTGHQRWRQSGAGSGSGCFSGSRSSWRLISCGA